MNNQQFSCPALFWPQRVIKRHTAGTAHPSIGRDALALPLRRFTRSAFAVDARKSGLRPAPALSVIWVTQLEFRFKYGVDQSGWGAAAAVSAYLIPILHQSELTI